jgi:peptidyl-prolyl cis-trans isomerase B (cyclophilin B)
MIDLETTDPAAIEAALVTSKGTMVVTFFADKAPNHVRNFLRLSQQGFYDGLAFHRVIRNFMVQGGCPNTRQGASGQPGTGRPPGEPLRAEFNDTKHVRGILSMARGRDANSAGSQFFFVHGAHAAHLDGQYTAFGRIEEGLEVLDGIAAVDCDFGPNGERSVPLQRIEIERIELRPRQERKPAEAVDGAGGGEPVEAAQ